MSIKNFATQRLRGFFYRKGAMTLSEAKIVDQIVTIVLQAYNKYGTLRSKQNLSSTNDFVTTQIIKAKNETEHKKQFINKVYKKENYRRITKEEACLIQGFPKDYILPDSRARWMKLIGNSVSVPVIDILVKTIIETGVFDNAETERAITEVSKKMSSTQQHLPKSGGLVVR